MNIKITTFFFPIQRLTLDSRITRTGKHSFDAILNIKRAQQFLRMQRVTECTNLKKCHALYEFQYWYKDLLITGREMVRVGVIPLFYLDLLFPSEESHMMLIYLPENKAICLTVASNHSRSMWITIVPVYARTENKPSWLPCFIRIPGLTLTQDDTGLANVWYVYILSRHQVNMPRVTSSLFVRKVAHQCQESSSPVAVWVITVSREQVWSFSPSKDIASKNKPNTHEKATQSMDRWWLRTRTFSWVSAKYSPMFPEVLFHWAQNARDLCTISLSDLFTREEFVGKRRNKDSLGLMEQRCKHRVQGVDSSITSSIKLFPSYLNASRSWHVGSGIQSECIYLASRWYG